MRTQTRARARRLGCEAAEAAPRILSSIARRAPVQPVGAAKPAWQDRPLPVRLALRLRGAAHALQLVDLHLGRRDDGSPAKVAREVPGYDPLGLLVAGAVESAESALFSPVPGTECPVSPEVRRWRSAHPLTRDPPMFSMD